MSATNKQDRIQINNTFGTNVENKRDSEWKSKIENQNRSLKKLRESSLSQERNKNRFDSYNNLAKQNEFESNTLKNRDLEEVFVDSDEDIKRHKQKINKHFKMDAMSESNKGRVEKQLHKISNLRNASLSDSSDEEVSQSAKTETIDNKSQDVSDQNDISDIHEIDLN